MAWQHQGIDFIGPNDKHFGFVYRITNLQTGRIYLGRKLFTKSKIQGITKKNKRRKKLRVASDWVSYWGSSDELLKDIETLGEEFFTREILHLTTKRGETNYFEALEILTSGALLSDNYYNKWVSLKLHKSSLAHLYPSHSSPISKSAPAIPRAPGSS